MVDFSFCNVNKTARGRGEAGSLDSTACLAALALVAIVVGLAPAALAQTDALEVTPEGNVGVGTATPEDRLHVVGADTGKGVRIEGDRPSLRLAETDTSNTNWQIQLSAGALQLATNNDAFNSSAPKLSLTQAGYLGLGTTAPTAALQVYGNNIADSLLEVSGTTTDYWGVNMVPTVTADYSVQQGFRLLPSFRPGSATTVAYGFNRTSLFGSGSNGLSALYLDNVQMQTSGDFGGTINTMYGYRAAGWAYNSSSGTPSVGTYYGFAALDPPIDATNANVAYHSGMTAGSGKYGLYFTGDAYNYLAGPLHVKGSNSFAFRLQGASGTEYADHYLGGNGNYVLDLRASSEPSSFFDLRTENPTFGLVMRASDGSTTGSYANLFMHGANQELRVTVSGGQGGADFIVHQDGTASVTGLPNCNADGQKLETNAGGRLSCGTASTGVTNHAYLTNVTASQHHAPFVPNSNPAVNHSGYVAGHGNGSDCSSNNLTYARGTDANGNAACSTPGEGPADNRLVRAHGYAGIQSSGVTLSDYEDMSGVRHLTIGGTLTLTRSSSNITFYPPTNGSLTLCYHGSRIKRCASSRALKKNIEALKPGEGLGYALRLQPRRFDWKDDGRADYGFIADEVGSVLPELAPEGDSVNYRHMVAVLTAAVQELAAKVERLEGRSCGTDR